MNIQKINFISPKINTSNNFKTTPLKFDCFVKNNVSFCATKTGMFDGKIQTKPINDLQFSALMVTVDAEKEYAESLTQEAKRLYLSVTDAKEEIINIYKNNRRRINGKMVEKIQESRNQLAMVEYIPVSKEVKRKSIFERGGILKSIIIPKTSNKNTNTIYEFSKTPDGNEYLTCTIDSQVSSNMGKKCAKNFQFKNGVLERIIIDYVETNDGFEVKKEIKYNQNGELSQINSSKKVVKGLTTVDKEIIFENGKAIKVLESTKLFSDKKKNCKCQFNLEN